VPLHRESPAPVPSEDDLHIVVGPDAGPEVDGATLRDFVESEAHKDAASGMYDGNLGTHGHPLIMEHKIDRWHHRWSAEAELRQHRDRKKVQLLHRGAACKQATGEQTEDHLEQDLRDACAYRDRMRGVVEGTEPGDDGGHWAAQSRIDENRRWESTKDWGIYLGAAFAEVGLNYTAFQLMGSSLKETVVLAASIILANVLLPKQLGELVTRVRRGRRGRGVLVAGLVGGAALCPVGGRVLIRGADSHGLPAATQCLRGAGRGDIPAGTCRYRPGHPHCWLAAGGAGSRNSRPDPQRNQVQPVPEEPARGCGSGGQAPGRPGGHPR
jgi:hypothetical protein